MFNDVYVVILLVACFFHVTESNIPGPSFLPTAYSVKNGDFGGINEFQQTSFYVRNVPGDGSCLFHSLAVSLKYKLKRCHEVFDEPTSDISHWLRMKACDVLCGALGETTPLVIEPGSEDILPSELQEMLAEKNDSSFDVYVNNMRCRHEWGGGPGTGLLELLPSTHSQ